jgi:hypothetical protein
VSVTARTGQIEFSKLFLLANQGLQPAGIALLNAAPISKYENVPVFSTGLNTAMVREVVALLGVRSTERCQT